MPDKVLLYVEDEDAAVFIFETTLRDVGSDIQFHRVPDGEQALAFVRRSGAHQDAPRPDLIVLDLNLPKLSGLQVLAAIKAEETLRPIPVIVLTASSLSSDKQYSLALGAQEFIIKPSSLNGFIEVVRNACLLVA